MSQNHYLKVAKITSTLVKTNTGQSFLKGGWIGMSIGNRVLVDRGEIKVVLGRPRGERQFAAIDATFTTGKGRTCGRAYRQLRRKQERDQAPTVTV